MRNSFSTIKRAAFPVVMLGLVLLASCAGQDSNRNVSSQSFDKGATGRDPAESRQTKTKDGFSYMQDGTESSDVDIIKHKTSF